MTWTVGERLRPRLRPRPSPRPHPVGPTTPAREARGTATTPAGPERSGALAAVSYRSHAHGTDFLFGAPRRHARHALRATPGVAGRGHGHRSLFWRLELQRAHALPRRATFDRIHISRRERRGLP